MMARESNAERLARAMRGEALDERDDQLSQCVELATHKGNIERSVRNAGKLIEIIASWRTCASCADYRTDLPTHGSQGKCSAGQGIVRMGCIVDHECNDDWTCGNWKEAQ